jgi:hypothetical protein
VKKWPHGNHLITIGILSANHEKYSFVQVGGKYEIIPIDISGYELHFPTIFIVKYTKPKKQ